jgi:HK97 family phage prohead protease
METTRAHVAHVRAVADRTIVARLAMYGTASLVGHDGVPLVLLPGAFALSLRDTWTARPLKLFRADDMTRAVGLATRPEDHPDGLLGSFRIAKGRHGDDVLADVAEGLLDGATVTFRTIRSQMSPGGLRRVSEAALVFASVAPQREYDDPSTAALRALLPPPPPKIDLTRPIYDRRGRVAR